MPRAIVDSEGATYQMSFKNMKAAKEWAEKQGGLSEGSEIRDYGVSVDGTPPDGWSGIEGGASIWHKG